MLLKVVKSSAEDLDYSQQLFAANKSLGSNEGCMMPSIAACLSL